MAASSIIVNHCEQIHRRDASAVNRWVNKRTEGAVFRRNMSRSINNWTLLSGRHPGGGRRFVQRDYLLEKVAQISSQIQLVVGLLKLLQILLGCAYHSGYSF